MKNSILRKMMLFFAVLIVLTITILISVYFYFSNVIRDNSIRSMEHTCAIYASDLNNDIDSIDNILQFVLTNDATIRQLSHNNESDRYFASINLKQLIQAIVSNNRVVDMILVSNTSNQVNLSLGNDRLTYRQRNSIEQYVCSLEEEDLYQRSQWHIETVGTDSYLAKELYYEGSIISAWVHRDTLLDEFQSVIDEAYFQYGLEGPDNEIWSTGSLFHPEIPTSRYRQVQVPIGVFGFSIVCRGLAGSTLIQFSIIPITILAIVVLSLILLFSFWIYLRKELYLPIRDLLRTILMVEKGNFRARTNRLGKSEEFRHLNASFDSMVDTIVNLRIASYERKLKLQEAELKYYHMRIRPHFFLNALNTINSMTFQGKEEEIRHFIAAFSKNIRYLFRNGLELVTVSEELHQLDNYFEMQEILYPGCVFYFADTDSSIMQWKIPHMLLHTFVENEYKHAVSMDHLLSIFIRIHPCTKGTHAMLHILVEDDGDGFPAEVIQAINAKELAEDDGKKIGLVSIKRILKLMYGRTDLMRLQNRNGGCVELWIPREPLPSGRENEKK